MDWTRARLRFEFLSQAFEATGGFAPLVSFVPKMVGEGESATQIMMPTLTGPSHLVRYPRESEQKYAARNAVAVYENHLRTACERYVGFLGRRKPQRLRADAPLVRAMIENADLRGNDLDSFWRQFALQARARGSMLLVIDKPQANPATLADQMEQRAVPYIRAAKPETVAEYDLDPETGLFERIVLHDKMRIDGKLEDVLREYTKTGWRITKEKATIAEGEHSFGACQVLAFTENGDLFPQVGKYAQIADLSRRLFNARSERDEILRGQTFSLLTLQIPPEQLSQFDMVRDKVGATIGTHSLLIHSGDQPGFIAPDSGPAQVYESNIEELRQSIARISMEDLMDPARQGANESGVSRRLRFEALNADLATFAMNLQTLERRMWSMWFRQTGGSSPVEASWPTDYNLADVLAELDVLMLMQSTGFPPAALSEKRRSIAATEFDNAPDDVKARIDAAIAEAEQAEQDPGAPTGNPEDDTP